MCRVDQVLFSESSSKGKGKVAGGSCNEITGNGVRDPWEPQTGVRGRTVLKWGLSVQKKERGSLLDGSTGLVAFLKKPSPAYLGCLT